MCIPRSGRYSNVSRLFRFKQNHPSTHIFGLFLYLHLTFYIFPFASFVLFFHFSLTHTEFPKNGNLEDQSPCCHHRCNDHDNATETSGLHLLSRTEIRRNTRRGSCCRHICRADTAAPDGTAVAGSGVWCRCRRSRVCCSGSSRRRRRSRSFDRRNVRRGSWDLISQTRNIMRTTAAFRDSICRHVDSRDGEGCDVCCGGAAGGDGRACVCAGGVGCGNHPGG